MHLSMMILSNPHGENADLSTQNVFQECDPALRLRLGKLH